MKKRIFIFLSSTFLLLSTLFVLSGCGVLSHEPFPGPDKQGQGTFLGAVTGAGTGAITGANISSATGPGAFIGLGLGAVLGAFQGYTQDQFEDELGKLTYETRREREVAYAQEVLSDHYQRRGELHPTRDIFPADLFFRPDADELRPTALPLLRELTRIHRDRYGWSRFAIKSYIKSNDAKSRYSKRLAERRAESIGNALTQMGFEPRRITPFGIIVKEPVLIDPLDHPKRYGAAIEIATTDLY